MSIDAADHSNCKIKHEGKEVHNKDGDCPPLIISLSKQLVISHEGSYTKECLNNSSNSVEGNDGVEQGCERYYVPCTVVARIIVVVPHLSHCLAIYVWSIKYTPSA